MPSPFPGMDPYLERPSLWPNVHAGLISQIQASLNQQLRPKYAAMIEDRVYIANDKGSGHKQFVPDIHIPLIRSQSSLEPSSTAAPAVAEVEPIEATTFFDIEIRESLITIVDCLNQSVVTVIEVLSPSNKQPGSVGESRYLEKRIEVMHSMSHLVEIDLLRAGNRLLVDPPLPPCDYVVHVSNGLRRMRATLWPIRLPQRLPKIPIPLLEGDPPAELDLQDILSVAYDRGAWDASLDYQAQPEPPLSPDQAVWADAVLRRAGLRGPAPA